MHLFYLAGFDTPGIGFIADQLVLGDCQDEDWVMCRFLKLHNDDVHDLTYFGKMLPETVAMTAKDDKTLKLGNGLEFRSLFFESHLSATNGDDRLTFKAQVVFTHTNDILDGKLCVHSLQFHSNLLQCVVCCMAYIQSDLQLRPFDEFMQVEFNRLISLNKWCTDPSASLLHN